MKDGEDMYELIGKQFLKHISQSRREILAERNSIRKGLHDSGHTYFDQYLDSDDMIEAYRIKTFGPDEVHSIRKDSIVVYKRNEDIQLLAINYDSERISAKYYDDDGIIEMAGMDFDYEDQVFDASGDGELALSVVENPASDDHGFRRNFVIEPKLKIGIREYRDPNTGRLEQTEEGGYSAHGPNGERIKLTDDRIMSIRDTILSQRWGARNDNAELIEKMTAGHLRRSRIEHTYAAFHDQLGNPLSAVYLSQLNIPFASKTRLWVRDPGAPGLRLESLISSESQLGKLYLIPADPATGVDPYIRLEIIKEDRIDRTHYERIFRKKWDQAHPNTPLPRINSIEVRDGSGLKIVTLLGDVPERYDGASLAEKYENFQTDESHYEFFPRQRDLPITETSYRKHRVANRTIVTVTEHKQNPDGSYVQEISRAVKFHLANILAGLSRSTQLKSNGNIQYVVQRGKTEQSVAPDADPIAHYRALEQASVHDRLPPRCDPRFEHGREIRRLPHDQLQWVQA